MREREIGNGVRTMDGGFRGIQPTGIVMRWLSLVFGICEFANKLIIFNVLKQ